MDVRYITAGGLRIDYLITADGQAHLREMGGNGIYSAVGARVWSAQVGILGRVGENYPSEWLQQLRSAGISTEGVHIVPGRQEMRTFYAYLDSETRVDTDPERHFARAGLPFPPELAAYVDSTPGQDGMGFRALSLRPSDLPFPYSEAAAAHLSPLDLSCHRTLPQALAETGIRVTLDPGEKYMKPAYLHEVLSLLRWVDVFLPSVQEVQSLRASEDLWRAGRTFSEAGPGIVVIKAGAQGSLLYDRCHDCQWVIPAYPCTVVDVTGAGDAYCGGLLVGLVETDNPVMAACYGTVSASFVLEGFGALYALQRTRAEAEFRLAQVRRAVEKG